MKSAGNEGALARDKRSQRDLELIGMNPTTEEAVEEISFREAILPLSLQELRQKLGRKAKQQKRFRFYSLYTWDWSACECLLEETTLAKAGWGKSPCPV